MDLLVGDGGQQVRDGNLDTKVGAVAPGAQGRIKFSDRLQAKAPFVESRMRHDQIVLGIGDASAIEGEDVEVDDARSPSATLGISAKRKLQALELVQEIGGWEIGLKLQRGIQKARLVERIARRALVEGGHPCDQTDAAKLGHRRAEGYGRFTQISPETDEGAHVPAL